MSVCKIPHCINDVQCPTLGLCRACYSSMLHAGSKSPAQLARRLRDLAKFQARTALMAGNVHPVPQRKQVTLTVLPGQVRPKMRLVKNKKLYVA